MASSVDQFIAYAHDWSIDWYIDYYWFTFPSD